jgi:hypothetical protein
MIIQILKKDERTGVKKGDIYLAKRYYLDPMEKVTLITRLTKKDRKPIGKDPDCNEYIHNVKILN